MRVKTQMKLNLESRQPWFGKKVEKKIRHLKHLLKHLYLLLKKKKQQQKHNERWIN